MDNLNIRKIEKSLNVRNWDRVGLERPPETSASAGSTL